MIYMKTSTSRERIIKKEFIVGAVIVLLQIIVCLYWAEKKENLFIDELYSMERATSYSGRGNVSYYVEDLPEWRLNEWMVNSEFKKYFIVSDEESMLNLSLTDAVRRLFSGRTYNGLLNLAMTAAGYSVISTRPGIVLNILIMIFCQLFFLIFMKRLGLHKWTQYAALVLFGFSGYMIGLTDYVRFYVLVFLLLIVILNLLLTIWNSNNYIVVFATMILASVFAYFSFRHSELTVAYFGALLFCFIVALILNKMWIKTLMFTSLLGIGLLYIAKTQSYFDALFHYSSTADYGIVGGFVNNIWHPSLGGILYFLKFLPRFFVNYYFGCFTAFTCLVLGIAIFLFSNRKSLSFSNIKMAFGGKETGFICVLLASGVMYTVFAALQDFSDNSSRYYFYGFMVMAIIVPYIIDRALVKGVPEEIRGDLLKILSFLVLLIAISPFFTRNVDYIYEEDGELKKRISEYTDVSTILLLRYENGDLSNHEMYDCIYNMSDEAKLYAVDLDMFSVDDVDLPNEFLLWTKKSRDISGVVEDISIDGYNVEELGTNHISRVIHMSKQ